MKETDKQTDRPPEKIDRQTDGDRDRQRQTETDRERQREIQSDKRQRWRAS